jgi:translation initiation factor 4A
MLHFRNLLVLELMQLKDKQVVFLSATIPGNLRDMTRNIMNDPVKILVKKELLTLEGIKQYFINMEKEEWKIETLCDLYNNETFTHPTVVFRNSRKKVDQLSVMLEERELAASATVRRITFSSTLNMTNSLFHLAWQKVAEGS